MDVTGKPLTPLTHGSVLIVGVKACNFDDEIKNHPRVILWDSQNEHWTNKSLPDNTRAVFMTRFIGHTSFEKIVSEARKRQITIFNPEGTGMIALRVRQLLSLTTSTEAPVMAETPEKTFGKLKPLIPFIDYTKSNVENARELMIKADQMSITTTEASLAHMISIERKKQSGVTAVPRSIQPKLDVSVEILDNIIKDITSMRDFLIATVAENNTLRAKLAHLKKALSEE